MGINKGRKHLFNYSKNNGLRYTDRNGFYYYDGNATYASGGEVLGGALMYVTLKSECCENKRLIGEYLVVTFGGGTMGAPVGKSTFSFEMRDGRFSGGPKLERMEGYSAILSATASLWKGYSVGLLAMGEGMADISGWLDSGSSDVSVDAFVGHSKLLSQKKECCDD